MLPLLAKRLSELIIISILMLFSVICGDSCHMCKVLQLSFAIFTAHRKRTRLKRNRPCKPDFRRRRLGRPYSMHPKAFPEEL